MKIKNRQHFVCIEKHPKSDSMVLQRISCCICIIIHATESHYSRHWSLGHSVLNSEVTVPLYSVLIRGMPSLKSYSLLTVDVDVFYLRWTYGGPKNT